MLVLLWQCCALFQLNEGRGIKVKCMKREDGNKEHFIWAENDEDMMKMKF